MSRSRWKVLVRNYPTGPVVAEVPFQEILFSSELNGVGGGSCAFDLDSEFLAKGNSYAEVIEKNNVWEFYQDDVCVAQFLAESPQIEYVTESRSRRVTVSGTGLAGALEHGLVLPPAVDGYPDDPGFPYNSGFFWSIAPFGRASDLIDPVTSDFGNDPSLVWKGDFTIADPTKFELYGTDGIALTSTVALDSSAAYGSFASSQLITLNKTAALTGARLGAPIFVEEGQHLTLRMSLRNKSGSRRAQGYVIFAKDDDTVVSTHTTPYHATGSWKQVTVPAQVPVGATKAIVGVQTTGTGLVTDSFNVGNAQLLTAIASDYRKSQVLPVTAVESTLPLWHYPLNEPSGAASATDLTKKASPAAPSLTFQPVGSVTSQTARFGDRTIPLASDLTALDRTVDFAPNSAGTVGYELSSAAGSYPPVGSDALGSTVSAFFYLDADAARSLAILTLSSTMLALALEVTSDSVPKATLFSTLAGSPTTLTGSFPVAPQEWHHVALTQSLSGGTVLVRLLVDGVEAASATYSNASILKFGGTRIQIGCAAGASLFQGNVANVAAHSRALSDAEIQAIADSRRDGGIDSLPLAANMMTHWHQMLGLTRQRFAADLQAAPSALTHLAVSFDGVRDSYGNPWPQDDAHTFGDSSIDESQTNGVSLFDLLETCSTAAGGTRADWTVLPRWNGSSWVPTLECAMNYGRDLTYRIAFFQSSVFGMSREIQRGDIRNFPVAQGDDGSVETYGNNYKTILSRSRFGRRETYIATSMAEEKHPYLDKEMHLYSDELSSWTVQVPAEVVVSTPDPASSPGHERDSVMYRPFIDYAVGDWIGIPTVGNSNLPDQIERLRITAMSGTVREDGHLTLEITLGSNIQLLRESQSAERG